MMKNVSRLTEIMIKCLINFQLNEFFLLFKQLIQRSIILTRAGVLSS